MSQHFPELGTSVVRHLEKVASVFASEGEVEVVEGEQRKHASLAVGLAALGILP
jgi:hypothetical protein